MLRRKILRAAPKDSGGILPKKGKSEGFSKIHTEKDILRYEFKTDMAKVNSTTKKLEKTIESTQEEVIEQKDQVQTTKEEMESLQNDAKEMGKKTEDLTKKNNTSLEQYTRRKYPRFNNFQESERKECKSVM